jgi:hypothetical protein
MVAMNGGATKMALYEVMYSTKPASKDELSFSDIILVEAESVKNCTRK